MKSKKKSLHVKMIHQVTQLQLQSIDDENNKYFIPSHKMYHFVPIYNQKNSLGSYCSRTFKVIISPFKVQLKFHQCANQKNVLIRGDKATEEMCIVYTK